MCHVGIWNELFQRSDRLSLQYIFFIYFFLIYLFLIILWESVEQKGLYFYFAFSKCQGQQQGFDYRGDEKAHREVSEMTYSPSIPLPTAHCISFALVSHLSGHRAAEHSQIWTSYS
jgi:hypothetical protein